MDRDPVHAHDRIALVVALAIAAIALAVAFTLTHGCRDLVVRTKGIAE